MTVREEIIQNLQLALYLYNRKPDLLKARRVSYWAGLLLKLEEILAMPSPKKHKRAAHV